MIYIYWEVKITDFWVKPLWQIVYSLLQCPWRDGNPCWGIVNFLAKQKIQLGRVMLHMSHIVQQNLKNRIVLVVVYPT